MKIRGYMNNFSLLLCLTTGNEWRWTHVKHTWQNPHHHCSQGLARGNADHVPTRGRSGAEHHPCRHHICCARQAPPTLQAGGRRSHLHVPCSAGQGADGVQRGGADSGREVAECPHQWHHQVRKKKFKWAPDGINAVHSELLLLCADSGATFQEISWFRKFQIERKNFRKNKTVCKKGEMVWKKGNCIKHPLSKTKMAIHSILECSVRYCSAVIISKLMQRL